MSGFLNAAARFLPTLWEMSVTAAYAAAVVAVLRLLLKRRAPRQLICLLWLVVFARLLIPVSLKSPLSIVPDRAQVQTTQPAPPEQAGPLQHPVGETGPAVPSGSGQAGPVPAAPGNAAPAAVPTGQQAGAAAPFPWRTALAGVWLAGAAAMCAFGLAAYLRLRRRLFDAIRAQDGAWEHPAVASPFILGVFRPRIYLPAGLAGRPRQFILCHERAHLRRLDHIVKPVCWAALALHWFNPLAWAAFLLMSRDIEAACDEAVIRQLGDEVKADYSATLLALATGRRTPSPCPLAFDEGDARGRIQNVLRYRRPALWIVAVSALAVLLAAVCLLTDPVAADKPDDPEPPASPAAQPPAPSRQQAAAQAPEAVPAPLPAVPGWAEAVLSGQRQFYSTDLKKQMDLEPLDAAFGYPDSFPDLDYQVALADLDGDGEAEVILEPCCPGAPADEGGQALLQLGYFILHANGGQVYGYAPGPVAFCEVKADGIYQFTCPFDGSNGWARARFTPDGLEPDPVILWLSPGDSQVEPDRADISVDGKPATDSQFSLAYERSSMKPAPTWYRWYGDTGLLPSVVPSDQSTYTPKFLGDGVRELYRQASYLYYHLFGESTAGICEMGSPSYWPSGLYDPADTVERDGLTYVHATGQFARWADLMAAVDALFTRGFWDACNQWDGRELFINVDGETYFLPASRLNGDYYGSGPAPFTPVEQTEDSIAVTLTAGYNRYQAGEDEAAFGRRTGSGYDYTVDYPIRLVKTEGGWRFDEFHFPRTDHRAYTLGHILWQTDPLHAANGWMDGAVLRQAGADTFLDWDGTTYRLEPDVNAATFAGRMYVLDLDGDGGTEAALVYRNEKGSPTIAVYERAGRGLQRATFDTGVLQSAFDGHAEVERKPGGGLALTHRGPRETTTIELSDTVFNGYEWLREGGLYAKMAPDIFYAGLSSEQPLSPPFSVSSFVFLSGSTDSNGPFVAHLSFTVNYDGARLALGELYLEPYPEFVAPAF